jgi:hypothetical protein
LIYCASLASILNLIFVRARFVTFPKVGFLGDSCTAWVVCELALVHCGVHTVCLLDTDDAAAASIEMLVCSTEWLAHAIDRGVRITDMCPVSARWPCVFIIDFCLVSARSGQQ